MQCAQSFAAAKKKAPSEDGADDLGPKSKSKVVAEGEGGGYADCRWIVAQGGGEGFNPVSQSRTEGGGNGAAHIDKANMILDRLVSNVPGYMPAMRFVQVVGVQSGQTHGSPKSCGERYAPKDKAPLEGRAGPSFADE